MVWIESNIADRYSMSSYSQWQWSVTHWSVGDTVCEHANIRVRTHSKVRN